MGSRWGVAAIALLPACTLLVSTSGLGGEAEAETGALEASVGADAEDGGVDLRDVQDATAPPESLQPGGTFEDDTTACSGFSAFNGTLKLDTRAHTGARACLVCSKAQGVSYTLDPGGAARSPSPAPRRIAARRGSARRRRRP